MITAMDANAYSEDYITAHHLIISQAELLNRRGYSRLIDGTYHDTYTAPKTGLSFRKKWVITQDSVFPYLLRNITVSVTWRRATRDAVQHKIETTFSVGRGT